jgi:hypothetical protein
MVDSSYANIMLLCDGYFWLGCILHILACYSPFSFLDHCLYLFDIENDG